MISTDTASRLARATLADGGATMALDGTIPVTGYAVALPGLERRYTLSESAETIASQVGAYALIHRAELEREGRYLGTWVDGGHLYIDTVRVIADRAAAELEGTLSRQLAIFDITNGAEIRLVPQVTP